MVAGPICPDCFAGFLPKSARDVFYTKGNAVEPSSPSCTANGAYTTTSEKDIRIAELECELKQLREELADEKQKNTSLARNLALSQSRLAQFESQSENFSGPQTGWRCEDTTPRLDQRRFSEVSSSDNFNPNEVVDSELLDRAIALAGAEAEVLQQTLSSKCSSKSRMDDMTESEDPIRKSQSTHSMPPEDTADNMFATAVATSEMFVEPQTAEERLDLDVKLGNSNSRRPSIGSASGDRVSKPKKKSESEQEPDDKDSVGTADSAPTLSPRPEESISPDHRFSHQRARSDGAVPDLQDTSPLQYPSTKYHSFAEAAAEAANSRRSLEVVADIDEPGSIVELHGGVRIYGNLGTPSPTERSRPSLRCEVLRCLGGGSEGDIELDGFDIIGSSRVSGRLRHDAVVSIEEGARVSFSSCTLRSEVLRAGVLVVGNSTLTVSESDLCGGLDMGITTKESASLRLERTAVRRCRGTGVVIETKGVVTIEGSRIEGNGFGGIVIVGRGATADTVSLSASVIRDNQRYGITLSACACASWRGGEVRGNERGPTNIANGCRLKGWRPYGPRTSL
eukprot:gnl/MRDRNA2_/MRDRNA2_144039_c0_seq1.p1 gnl/MRDRNA2_/MRDRNA2_144039_c0~~gnl/MRDRNA2_/MRDRNA2_144039_c0_seq1.p1  ORF type:complete len:567 (+),score=86.54 gnl/MRDRNA2_/MRDRNA2_144039_c0_seq1:116-1816(+)